MATRFTRRPNFYLEPVKRNQRFSAFWGENYLDFAASDSWDFRVGAQQIIWGEVIGLFFADVVSARDEREFLLPRFDYIRIPQWAARAEYFAGDSHVEFIWIPVPDVRPDRQARRPISTRRRCHRPTPPAVAALFLDPQHPDRSLSNSNYGCAPIRSFRVGHGGVLLPQLSASPTFYRLPTGNPAQPFVFQPRFDRIWQAGGNREQGSRRHGAACRGRLRERPRLRHDRPFGARKGWCSARRSITSSASTSRCPGDTRLNVQGFQRALFNGGGGNLVVKSDGFGASIFLSTKLSAAFEPQILWIQSFKNAGGLVRPRLNWYPAKNTAVGFGVDIFIGRTTVISAATTTVTASTRICDTISSGVAARRRSYLVPSP
jgi:hypothetical protein